MGRDPLGTSANDEARRLGFVARLLVATTLPHSKPADIQLTRTNGLYELCLRAPRQVGLPYGRYPRLALAWMMTEAVKRKTPLLPLARSLSQFACQIGVTPSTGRKGTLANLRDQVLRLVHLSIVCLDSSPARYALPVAFRGGGVHLVERSLLWWDPPCGDQGPFILLSQDFYDEVIAHPVPIDLDVVRSLRSPLAIDAYTWLTYRSLRACRIGRPETVSWEALRRQFGAGYTEVRAFRFHLLRAIKNILQVYPELRLRSSRAGLVLLPYPPHIPPRACR
jgi:replication initiator protein